MLAIRPVRTPADLKTFITLPRVLYLGMPGYVAPLDFERRQLLDPKKSAYFTHAEVQYFLAYSGDRPVGRISAQVDRLAIETWGENIGCFGCLDAIDDAAVVRALCDAAAGWLRQRGMVAMRGPFTLSINNESGVMVGGQERGAMVFMPWHPPYLAGLVEAAGLSPAKDLLAFTMKLSEYVRPERFLKRAERSLPKGLQLRKLDLKNFGRDAEIIGAVYNDAWQHNWGFVPIAAAESAAFAQSFKHLLTPEMGLIAEVEGRPIAVGVVLPNLFDVTSDFGGRLLPFNWLRFLTRAFRESSYRNCRVTLLGRIQEVRSIGGLLALLIIDTLIQRNPRFRAGEVEMGWVLDDNRMLINLMHTIGIGDASKRYRVFEKSLAG